MKNEECIMLRAWQARGEDALYQCIMKNEDGGFAGFGEAICGNVSDKNACGLRKQKNSCIFAAEITPNTNLNTI